MPHFITQFIKPIKYSGVTWQLSFMFCEGHSEMIFTYFICSNFIIFRLNTKQLLAQHIPLQGCTLLLLAGDFQIDSWNSSSVVLYHLWTATFPVSKPLLKVLTQMNTMLYAGAFSPQTADVQIMSDGLTPSFHRNHVVRLPIIIAFHFATLVCVLQH